MIRQRFPFAHVFFATVVGFVFTLLVGALVTACGAPSKTELEAASEAKYEAQQVACAQGAKTLADSRACRAQVDLRWGITHAPPTLPASTLVRTCSPADLMSNLCYLANDGTIQRCPGDAGCMPVFIEPPREADPPDLDANSPYVDAPTDSATAANAHLDQVLQHAADCAAGLDGGCP